MDKKILGKIKLNILIESAQFTLSSLIFFAVSRYGLFYIMYSELIIEILFTFIYYITLNYILNNKIKENFKPIYSAMFSNFLLLSTLSISINLIKNNINFLNLIFLLVSNISLYLIVLFLFEKELVTNIKNTLIDYIKYRRDSFMQKSILNNLLIKKN